MKYYFGAAFAAAVLACLPVRAETYVFPGDRPAPSTTLKIVDERPAEQRASKDSQLSYLVTSCSYGIYRLADSITSPHKLELLRADLEKSLGSQLNDKTLTVWSYAIYRNSGKAMRSTAFAVAAGGAIGGALGGMLGSLGPDVGPDCSREETPEGWYDPSETAGQDAPLIAQVGARMDGRNYAVRAVSVTSAVSFEQALGDLLHRANTALADKIRGGGSGPASMAAAANSAFPFGIKSAGAVTSGSVTSIYFRNDPHGVAIGTLEPTGVAAQAGIQQGDVITALDGKRIDTLADLMAAASGAAGSNIKAEINRSGQILAVQIHH